MRHSPGRARHRDARRPRATRARSARISLRILERARRTPSSCPDAGTGQKASANPAAPNSRVPLDAPRLKALRAPDRPVRLRKGSPSPRLQPQLRLQPRTLRCSALDPAGRRGTKPARTHPEAASQERSRPLAEPIAERAPELAKPGAVLMAGE